jgi:hypothetical protein
MLPEDDAPDNHKMKDVMLILRMPGYLLKVGYDGSSRQLRWPSCVVAAALVENLRQLEHFEVVMGKTRD